MLFNGLSLISNKICPDMYVNNDIVYLDYAATTPTDKRVIDEMLPFFDTLYFNASSNNIVSKAIKSKIEEARERCASLINADKEEIIFTSGATEAINLALKGYFDENFDKGNHLITCKTEHKAVLNTCAYLEARGIEVTYLDVDKDGQILLLDLENAIKPETSLISLMYVNNETGVINDIKGISTIAKAHNIILFCDATQAVGKLNIDVNELGIDLLCMSAHKIEGPKGVGFLYKRKGLNITPLIHGGTQENNLRGGTYNSPLIIGLGKACDLAKENFDTNKLIYKELSEYLLSKINENSRISLISRNANKVNNIFNLYIDKIDAGIFVSKSEKVYVSNGSACTSMIIEGSHVLKAMGYTDEECNHCLRVSLGPKSTIQDLDLFFIHFKDF